MRVSDWLRQAQDSLENAGIVTARLDALVLLEDETSKDRGWLLSHSEYTLQISNLEKLHKKIVQRTSHIPLAYIRGHAEFYGREFAVSEHTLVPRSETEAMIEQLKALDFTHGTTILDVGTGSGCIAITAALEFPGTTIRACDIDKSCLTIAERNANQLHAPVFFYNDDLLTHAEPCEVLLANLPYVPNNFHINTAAKHEPAHAIFGGSDGLELFGRMFDQIKVASWKPKHVFTESLPSSHSSLTDIAKVASYQLMATDDFVQRFSRP